MSVAVYSTHNFKAHMKINFKIANLKVLFEYRETNLMSLALLFYYLMLKMFRRLIHPTSGACDLFVELFHRLYCSGSMCVGVALWFGWGGVVSMCRLQPAYGYHTNPATPKLQHIETRTHNQCGDTIEKSQVVDDDCINVRNILSIEEVK